MPFHDWFVRTLAYPAWQRRRGGRVQATLARLERTQWWQPADLAAHALVRLRALVTHAIARSPYYRGAFAAAGVAPQDIRTLDVLPSLPVLEKETLRERMPDLLTIPPAGLVKRRTSGSTGIPVLVWAGPEARDAWTAASLRLQGWWGIRLGDRRLTWISRTGLTSMNWIKQFVLANTLEYSSLMITEAMLARLYARVASGGVRALLGYPSSLTYLAGYAAARGLGPPAGLRAVFTTGETLHADQRALLRRVFQCPVVDEYGSSETGHIAGECPEGRMHVAAENALVEYVPPRTPHPSGAREVLITDLTNLATPLIRYRLGDLAEPDAACPCGRGLPVLRLVAGRTSELVALPDGRRLDFTVFAVVFEALREEGIPIDQYRVTQRTLDEFAVHVAGLNVGAHAEVIRTRLLEALRANVRVHVEAVTEISPDPAGKRRRFISQLTRRGQPEEMPAARW